MSDDLEIVSAPAIKNEDLSREISRTVDRLAGDQVRCVRIVGNRYRCNWWARADSNQYDNPSMKGGQIGSTFRIRDSRFLEVVKSGGKLVITDLSI